MSASVNDTLNDTQCSTSFSVGGGYAPAGMGLVGGLDYGTPGYVTDEGRYTTVGMYAQPEVNQAYITVEGDAIADVNVPAGYMQANYEPVTQYYSVAGVLPMEPTIDAIAQVPQVVIGAADVAVPMPEIPIPIPEPNPMSAVLPTAVAGVQGPINFAALENNEVGGAIYGLGIPVADTVAKIATIDTMPMVGLPAMPEMPYLGGEVPILTNEQIMSLLVEHGVDSERVANMLAQVQNYLGTSASNSYYAVTNGMNSMINSGVENWQNIANVRNSLADLVGGIQRDQSTAVKEGLATLLAGAGESNEKTNLIAQALSSMFIDQALSQQSLINAAVNQLVKTNVGNMDNANTIIAQLTEAFMGNQAVNTPAMEAELNELLAMVAANTPNPVSGAILNPGIPVGEYIAGASSAAVGNPALDALAASAGFSDAAALASAAGYADVGALGSALASAGYGINGNMVIDGNLIGNLLGGGFSGGFSGGFGGANMMSYNTGIMV